MSHAYWNQWNYAELMSVFGIETDTYHYDHQDDDQDDRDNEEE